MSKVGIDMSQTERSPVERGLGTGSAVVTLAAAWLALSPVPLAAQDMAWSPFRDATGSVPGPPGGYDRAFVRDWEANPPKGFPTLAAANVEATKGAIKHYQEIVAKGGWPMVPDVQVQSGSSHQAVAVLRERLLISGDLKETTTSYIQHFDFYLEKAVKRFQASNGLSPTGIVDKRTIIALNVPAQSRLKQLQSNLPRLQELAKGAAKKYVMVNIPGAQIEAVEDGRVVSRHAGVVGKIDRPTPILKSAVHEMNFNPVWHLPPTVISKDLIPKGREMQRAGQSVLVKYGIDAYDGAGKKLDPNKVDWNAASAQGLTFKQQPGKENPMGFLKINFHNQYSVYMHDTPSESLFGRNFRAASSGCVRVSGIEQLAAWMLSENGDWAPERIQNIKKSGERADVRLKRAVPLYFAYITAWATEDGVVQFRRDLYQKDGIGAVAAAY